MKIALAGNPNVGKSTLFNALTKGHQHTGNWSGKTVSNAVGKYKYNNEICEIYDLPGTYSLLAYSKEEEIARDSICYDDYDAIFAVCDATCLQRSLNLVMQIIEITDKVIVCINMIDEAKKKNIVINIDLLSKMLNVPVVALSACRQKNFDFIFEKIKEIDKPNKVIYSQDIEAAISYIIPDIEGKCGNLNTRWVALNILNGNNSLKNHLQYDFYKELKYKLWEINENTNIKERIVTDCINKCDEITDKVVTYNNFDYNKHDRYIDKILTNKLTGIPLMIIMLAIIFYITIFLSNYPSELLFKLFSFIESKITLNCFPLWLRGLLVDGVYRVTTWVIAVMLPPMAIFFPLFTICEDLGLLPRIAFNLDGIFAKCNACGKQALSMCMGFGCNAVGVEGTRIIDSARERLIAILTNVFVPCNGRFPMIIAIITMFLSRSSITSAFFLTLIILFGAMITFLVSYILSKTLLKGLPSSFTLELPPYRKPQIIKVIIRSVFERTIFVLGRSVIVAAPMGAIIWILANVDILGNSLLSSISQLLNPFGLLIGMDGIILLGFLLGFPANEIVMPIILMCYLKTNNLVNMENVYEIRNILLCNGWTIKTAICVLIFSLCHFPCSTTCLTIKKETRSFKWMLLAIVIPTVVGIVLCLIINILCILIK